MPSSLPAFRKQRGGSRQARPMQGNRSRSAASSVQSAPSLNVSTPDKNLAGGVILPAQRPTAPDFIIVMTANGSVSNATKYYLFDANGLVTAIDAQTNSSNVTVTGTTGTNAFYLAQVKQTANEPLQIVGINYKSSTSAQKQIKVVKGDTNGSRMEVAVINPFIDQRNTQYQTNLLTLDCNFILDGDTAVIMQIDTSEVVTLGFFVGSRINQVS